MALHYQLFTQIVKKKKKPRLINKPDYLPNYETTLKVVFSQTKLEGLQSPVII